MTETEGRYRGPEKQLRPCDPFVEAVLTKDAAALDRQVDKDVRWILEKEADYLSDDEIRELFGPEYLEIYYREIL